jgi:LysM repeat protein
LAGSTIGIKIADGSYYPVLEESFTGTKRLTLTTVKDDQDRVQIDLYRGEGNTLGHAQYVGSLIIENIPPAAQGEPEIELILGIDASGELTAEASDRSTGESQVFSIGIRTLAEGETYEVPEFAVEPGGDTGAEAATGDGLDLEADTGTGSGEMFDEVPLTGDAYPVSGADRRRVPLHHRAPGRRAGRPALVAILVVLAVALFAALGYVAWRLIWGPPIPPLSAIFAPAAGEPAETATEPATATTAAAAAKPAASTAAAVPASTGNQSTRTQPAAGSASAAASTGTSTAAGGGVSYRIKRGDTLWDISSTYYRNPWLYPVIARANGIKNPDLIIAGARIFIPEQ